MVIVTSIYWYSWSNVLQRLCNAHWNAGLVLLASLPMELSSFCALQLFCWELNKATVLSPFHTGEKNMLCQYSASKSCSSYSNVHLDIDLSFCTVNMMIATDGCISNLYFINGYSCFILQTHLQNWFVYFFLNGLQWNNCFNILQRTISIYSHC